MKLDEPTKNYNCLKNLGLGFKIKFSREFRNIVELVLSSVVPGIDMKSITNTPKL